MNKLFYIETYGCKLNQFDSERIRDAFSGAGFEETDNPALAECIVINSCAVTSNAEKDSKARLRKLNLQNPDAKKFFIGCFTGNPDTENTLFLKGKDKFSIELIQNTIQDFPEFQKQHARPLIQIQNGCNLSCSYCIVPSFRGNSVSLGENLIMEQISHAVSLKKEEVVLTGIHLGTWGHDMKPKRDFSDLLESLETRFSNQIKIRISSLDSNEISDRMIKLFKHSQLFQPHFHIPLQSGSQEILKKMRRRYRPDQFLKTVSSIREAIPDACLGTDVIIGFPGETDALFEETHSFLEKSPLNYFHVFPYSIRKGTDAAEMNDQIDSKIKKDRVKTLKKMSDKKKSSFILDHLNTERNGVVIYPDTVLTDNYINVKLGQKTSLPPSSGIMVKLNKKGKGLYAEGDLIYER